MESGADIVKIASRILVALSDRRDPDSKDVSALRRQDPGKEHLPLDELACAAIYRALKQQVGDK